MRRARVGQDDNVARRSPRTPRLKCRGWRQLTAVALDRTHHLVNAGQRTISHVALCGAHVGSRLRAASATAGAAIDDPISMIR